MEKTLPPFDGLTVAFASEELTPLPALHQALLVVIPALQRHWLGASLFVLDDWHEHDGYVTIAQPTTWFELLQRAGTDAEIMAFTHGDRDVRLAFFPEDYGFYPVLPRRQPACQLLSLRRKAFLIAVTVGKIALKGYFWCVLSLFR